MSERIEEIRCGCGSLLTAEEIRYYTHSCERCEKAWLSSMEVAGIPLPENLKSPDEVLERGKRLTSLVDEGAIVLAHKVIELESQLSTISTNYTAMCDEWDTLRGEVERVTAERDTDVFFARGHMGPEVLELTQKVRQLEAELAAVRGELVGWQEKASLLELELEVVEMERDRLREAVEWQPITESTMPEWHKPVALLDINRFQNCHFDLNIHDVGYLEGEAPNLYWSIRGERAQVIEAYTHYFVLPPQPTTAEEGEGT